MKPQGDAAFTKTLEAFARYGAFELKRSYQKHLGLAVIIAGVLHIVIIWGFLLYADGNSTVPEETQVFVFDQPIEEIPPPPIGITKKHHSPVDDRMLKPITTGIAEAAPDEEVPTDADFATQEELSRMADQDIETLLEAESADSIEIKHRLEQYLPARGEYVHHDQAPSQLNQVTYTYPPLALQAGIEGTVWIEALVDKNGNVRDAVVVKPSGCNAGFEEAALEGAYKIKYTPALSNNQPVAVRVSYPVHFKLK